MRPIRRIAYIKRNRKTHNVVPVRQGEVVLVVTLVLLRKQETRGTLRLRFAE